MAESQGCGQTTGLTLGARALAQGWGRTLAALLPQPLENDRTTDGRNPQVEAAAAQADGQGSESGEMISPLLEFVQEENEVLFVPSGWWHQVLNEAPTLSINHNWINTANVRWSWEWLQRQRGIIRREVFGRTAATSTNTTSGNGTVTSSSHDCF